MRRRGDDANGGELGSTTDNGDDGDNGDNVGLFVARIGCFQPARRPKATLCRLVRTEVDV